MSYETVIVAPHTGGDDAAAALVAHNPAHAPTMDALVAPSRYARPYLSLVPRDAIVAAVEALDAAIDPVTPTLHSEVMEIRGPALTLFRFGAGGRPVIIDMPTELASPAVRGRLFDLLVELEREAITRGGTTAAATAVALTVLPIA